MSTSVESRYACDYAANNSRQGVSRMRRCRVTGAESETLTGLGCSPQDRENCARLMSESSVNNIRSGGRAIDSGVKADPGEYGQDTTAIFEDNRFGT